MLDASSGGMRALDRLIPMPRLLERDFADLAADPARVWQVARHLDLARSPFVRALFAVRTVPARIAGTAPGPAELKVDDLRSSPERPGFQILDEDPPREFTVGAVGKVWHLDIPFVHVADAEAFASFAGPDEVKVAWALRVEPRGGHDTRLTMELRVDATDDAAWRKFQRYFAVIGPASRFIRHSLLNALSTELGTPASRENARPLPGDDLLPDAEGQVTHGVTIDASPEAVWPWLIQMGCRRAGFYSYDRLDNGGVPSAREVHPELQFIKVGDVLPATPGSDDGFEVLRLDPGRALVLGGLFDVAEGKQRPFAAARPPRYWHVTWAFALEPLDGHTTRLHVRARAAIPPGGGIRLAWMHPVHSFMEHAQLRHIKARAEGRLSQDTARDVLSGLAGAGAMVFAMLTPFLRDARSHWGLDSAIVESSFPGDALVPAPQWGWTHGIEIDAPAEAVWPWVAQIGADRGGFYSHQWLENVVGCDVRNAESVHPEWAAREGSGLLLHPGAPPLSIVEVVPGRFLLAYGAPDEAARAAGRPWLATSWLFAVDPIGPARSRFISRFRVAHSPELTTRLEFGPALVAPIGFVMDRRMLLGVKERAERARHAALAHAG
jgi:hypothetical protein